MKKVFLLNAVFTLATALNPTKPCKPIQTEYGYSCKCTDDYCDTLNVPEPESANQFVFITSSKDGDRFSYENGRFSSLNSSNLLNEERILQINQQIEYGKSKIIGFGGGWTGSVQYILSQFTPKLRKYFLQSYFSQSDGIGYNMIRIPIGGSDFDLEPWTYEMESPNDIHLLNFTKLDERDKARNLQIKEIQNITGNDSIKILAAAWSPPIWAKAKQQWCGKADNQLLPRFYQTLANYHAKWLNLMKDDGVSVWGISTGNEPSFAVNQKCNFTANSWEPGNQADWLIDHLVPALRDSGNSQVKIHIFDDNRNVVLEYLKKMHEQREDVMEYSDFINIHGYFDNFTSPDILDEISQSYDKQILYTETSFAIGANEHVLPGSWSRAEELIKIIMKILQHDVAAYIDWNLILKLSGGPSYFAKGAIEALILTNDDYTVFYKQPFYYAMAHFSKFLPPHSMRVDLKLSEVSESQVQAVAYLRPDKKVTVILHNHNTIPIDLTLVDDLGRTNLSLKPKSLNTFVYSTKIN